MNDGRTAYFDAFVQVGPRPRKHPAHAWSLGQALDELDRCGVGGALIASTLSVAYEPMHGNRRLSAELAGRRHVYAAWNALPANTGEFPEPEELGRLMARHDAKAVTLAPASNRWELLARHNRPLLAWLERTRTLTVIARAELRDYRELEALLSAHPRLPLLLTGAHWSEQRYLLPLFRARRNLHLTFDHLQANRLIEHLVETGHGDRVLFGSDAPTMSVGAHRMYVDYAEIPERARRAIAGGNLARLLRVDPPPLRLPRDEDAIVACARRGRPLPTPVIDMHMHVLHEGMHGAGGVCRMQDGGPRGVFRSLARLGVVGGGFMSWQVAVGDSLPGNETVRAALDAAPPGFWGLASIDPAHTPGREFAAHIARIHADPRMVGMKPYHVHRIEYHHRSWDPWWRYGNERGFYALIHRVRDDFAEVDALARRYPRVRWVVAHCGESHHVADLAIETMRRHRNVYAELTLTPVTAGVVEHLVEHAGADRVLYGSDLPMRDPRQQLGWVAWSRLPLAVKRQVMGGNALAVIAPCARALPARNRPVAAPARRRRDQGRSISSFGSL